MDLAGAPWQVRFGGDQQPGRYRLVEFPEALLKEIEGNQGSGEPAFYIRGNAEDEAVLCTPTATFLMRDAENSNSLLLSTVDSDARTLTVRENLGGVIELARIPPRLAKVREMLNRRPYAGVESEVRLDRDQLYGRDELLAVVQASEAELSHYLDVLHAFMLDGVYRVLEPSYLDELLATLFACALSNRWPADAVPVDLAVEEIVKTNAAFCDASARNAIDAFSDKAASQLTPGGTVALSPERVCLHFAERLFEQSARWNYEAWNAAWAERVGPLFAVDRSVLAGHALLEPTLEGADIVYFPSSALPLEPLARFQRLFAVRPRWQHSDIVPYIRDIAASDIHLDSLLLKHTRPFTDPQGTKMYSTRF